MSNAFSRRDLVRAGSGALASAALVSAAPGAHAGFSQASKNEEIVRTWYRLWGESRDWAPFGAILAEDFTFSSTNGEDHISKDHYKQRCWAPNVGLTKGCDLELMMAEGDQVFVKYLGHTTGGKSFRNVELHRLRNGQITSTECYFGGSMSFPSGVDPQKS
jgi:ketosteroid isomerase-like protein